jgi:hypothetical protein
MKERTIVPDLFNCQADEKSTLIAVRVDAIEHPPHDCLGTCGCGVGLGSLLLSRKEPFHFFTSITIRKNYMIERTFV